MQSQLETYVGAQNPTTHCDQVRRRWQVHCLQHPFCAQPMLFRIVAGYFMSITNPDNTQRALCLAVPAEQTGLGTLAQK